MSKYGLVISGFGGQGVLFCGYLFAHTAMLEGKKVTWVPSYGVEMRGGTAHCLVQISDIDINSPLIEEPDALLAFNKPSYDKFHHTVKNNGVIIFNKTPTENLPPSSSHQLFSIEAGEIAKELGDNRVANLVIIGAFVKHTKVLYIENIYRALEEVLPPHKLNLIDANIKALKAGHEYDLCSI